MIISDTQIGANLARARGEMSQRELAKRMRSEGFPWTHLTVAAVERGDRPLRVSEAVQAADLVGTDVEELLTEEFTAWISAEIRSLRNAVNIFYAAVSGVEKALEQSDVPSRALSAELADKGTSDLDYLRLRMEGLRKLSADVVSLSHQHFLVGYEESEDGERPTAP